MRQISKVSLGAAVAALAVSPVQAAELPQVVVPGVQADYATQTVLNDGADEAEQRRRRLADPALLAVVATFLGGGALALRLSELAT